MIVDNLINGENFKKISNVVIDEGSLQKTHKLNDDDILFVKTDFLSIVFNQLRNCTKKLKLITHISDYPITEEMFENRPECIKVWFAQNVNYKNDKLIPIPIGIENHEGFGKGTCIDLDFIEKELFQIDLVNKKDRIYCNFNNTNPNRELTRKILKTNHICDFSGSGELKYSEYFKELASYKFVASPAGNGIDCHRTWESMLVGSVPIVERHFMYDQYPNLPLIQIDNWENDIDLEKLNDKLSKINVNKSQLFMNYWENLIKGYNI